LEGGCRALYLGPELPLELRDLRTLTWVKAVAIEPLDEGLRESARLIREGLYDCVAFTSPRGPLLLRGFLDNRGHTDLRKLRQRRRVGQPGHIQAGA